MPQLIWAPPALASIARLHRFLHENNQDAARRAVRAIRKGVGVLRQHPQLGRPVPELEAEFREWLIEFGRDGYVVLYRYNGEEVVILAVRHMREAGY